jgi:uncharacterized alpha-E superfamily protein
MGRRLERATTLVLLLSTTLVDHVDTEKQAPLLEALLDIADSGMTYRRRYLANLQAAPVVDLLLTDETNPRSTLFQVRAIVSHMEALPAPTGNTGMMSPQLRAALTIQSELQLVDVEAMTAINNAGTRRTLGDLLERLAAQIPALSEALSSGYLSHAAVSRHLGAAFRRPSSGIGSDETTEAAAEAALLALQALEDERQEKRGET